MNQIYQHQLDNGLWLLAEPIESAQSLSLSMLIPGAVAAEPDDQQGVATLLAEMICRGAGELDARAHSDALDQLGIHRDTHAGIYRMRLGATMIGTRLMDGLPLLTDMIRRPMLAEAALEPSRDLALQALDALEDEPQEKVFIELRRRHYPDPFGRSPMGLREHLEKITLEQIGAFRDRTFVPGGSVLAFAGRFDWDGLRKLVEQLLGDWRGEWTEPAKVADPPRGYVHQSADSTQVHIGLAYDALPEPDDRSILQRAAVAVLSGGMSGRLFTEVREKRGLCYAVYASYSGHRDRGAVFSYAGTTAARAQETLDVLTGELRRISEGVARDEFDRAIVGMKSRLVMQGESTGARAGAIASDLYTLGEPRTLDELARRVDAVTLDDVNAFVKANPPAELTIVTVGPSALTMPESNCASSAV